MFRFSTVYVIIIDVRERIEKIKKHGTALAFILGFIWDNFMLDRIDHAFANIMLGTYLSLSILCVIVLNIREKKRSLQNGDEKYSLWLAYILQFSLGSLFSAFIILYGRSASHLSNWLFIAILGAFVVINEIYRKKYFYIVIQLSILFIVIFAYSILALPVLVGKIGVEVFMVSGLLSLFVMWMIAKLIEIISPDVYKKERYKLIFSVTSIYFLFTFAYFANIIPPVPLSLKEIGIYHSVAKTSEGLYSVSFEKPAWYEPFNKTSEVFHDSGENTVYVLSSVFAPTKITTPIYHEWFYLDSKLGWTKSDRIEFPITGGRDEGFRGYSTKSEIGVGKWRVDVTTDRGSLIGRINFEVVESAVPPSRLVIESF